MIARALARARRELDELGVSVTAGQLYYATCRVLLPLHGGPRRPGYLLPPPIPRAAFDRALAASGDPAPVRERVPVLAGMSDAPDLLDYGLPRVLVCQHDGIAAMLLANDVHMECATLVLGASQVVTGLPPQLETALAAAPATVHLLHDATLIGASWRAEVEAGLLAPSRVVALGLRPTQARMLHLFRAPSGGAQLAGVPPDHLLRVLRRLLAGRGDRPEPAASLRGRARLGFLSWPGDEG